MKQFMIVLGILTAGQFSAHAQSRPKLYAYSQEVIPGTRPARTVDESGKITESTPATSTHYLLYIAAGSAQAFAVKGVWVNGIAYTATLQKVSSPVVMGHPTMPGKKHVDTLVGGEHPHVWMLQLEKSSQEPKVTRQVKLAMAANEAVISWQAGRKKGLSCAKTIKKLPAVALQ